MQRTVPLRIEDDNDLRATLESYRIIQQTVAEIAATSKKASSAIDLHRLCYARVRGHLKAQLVCTAIRSVSSAYARRGDSKTPIRFNETRATFLIGKSKRDAGINNDGTLSIWTVVGRKKLKFTTPDAFKQYMVAATSFDALCIAVRRGKLHATLSVTIPDLEPIGALPVGVDFNETNAIAAVDVCGRSMRVDGKAHRIMMKTGEKTRRRLEERFSIRKAEDRETRSVRRLLKRLSRKRYLQTKDFCNRAAKLLISWARPNSTIVMEDFRHKAPSKRKLAEARPEPAFYEIIRRRIEEKAALVGIRVDYVVPSKDSLSCFRCGSTGAIRGETFNCSECGLSIDADKNDAINVRNRFTVLKAVGCGQPAPKLDNG
jgi:putative transposase